MVAGALSAWADGRHPTEPGVASLAVDASTDLWRARHDAATGEYTPVREGGAPAPTSPRGAASPARSPSLGGRGGSANSGAGPAELGEIDAISLMEASARPSSEPSAVVCADDYAWWARHNQAPRAGKPVWVTLRGARDGAAASPTRGRAGSSARKARLTLLRLLASPLSWLPLMHPVVALAGVPPHPLRRQHQERRGGLDRRRATPPG